MPATDPDVLIAVVRRLHLSGDWDFALALLTRQPTGRQPTGQQPTSCTEAAELRAQVLIDRHWWRQDDPAPARAALGALEPHSVQASYLGAQLAYQRILFKDDPADDDLETADAGFTVAAQDDELRGWGTFWLGVVADNLREDAATARIRYDEALELCRSTGDLLLESYVVRHLGGHVIEGDRPTGEMLLRRSLHLRSALGARPQTAAAQVALAAELADGPERRMLREAARATVDELGLTWLKGELTAG